MSDQQQRFRSPGAVYICFAEAAITTLFAELLRARGVAVQILTDLRQVPSPAKVITEPQFFPLLSNPERQNCLLVGNKNTLMQDSAICLSRPLTEAKVEKAICEFLAACQ